MKNTSASGPAKTRDIESQIATFLAKYDPAIGVQLREARYKYLEAILNGDPSPDAPGPRAERSISISPGDQA